ncbi:MAG: sodium-dependent transporter [Acidimicrobiia bacterium]|nr:sodium-dependent transporter [Acidimicrobiia bacterium]
MAAAAVGLGNLWRFPYLAGEYGGGGFILAYLLAMVVVCLPLMYLEVAAGRLAQGNTVHTFRQVHPAGVWYGWFVVGLTTVITSYYLVITGWTMGYAVDAVRQQVRPFADFSAGYASLLWLVVVLGLGGILLVRGLSALETFSKAMMPVLLVVVIGLVVAASRTAGWEQAKDFLLSTDLSALRDPTLWVIAFGQGFYSLAIGQGYLVTYGSYIPTKTNVPRASLAIAGTETCIALLAGWMIFPFVFTHGLDPGEGSQLAFNTLPRAFEAMAWGAPLAIAFFALFCIAAFSSSLAGLKVILSAVAEEFRLRHVKAVVVVVGVMLVLALPSALSFTPLELSIGDTRFLDWVDQNVGGQVILFSGIFGAGFFCWLVPPSRLQQALGTDSRWWIARIYLVGRWLPVAVLVWIAVTIVW